MGGYFIINGNERIIRLVVNTRRNHVFVFNRPSWSKRGPNYSSFGASIRCLAPDQTAHLVTLHYLSDGTATVRFQIKKREFLIPAALMMKALCPASDRELYERVCSGDMQNTFVTDRIELLLRAIRELDVRTHAEALSYLGAHFRIVMGAPTGASNVEIGQELLRKYMFVHLGTDNQAKLDLLIFMLQRVYSAVKGDTKADNADAPSCHEIALPGHMMMNLLKDTLEGYLNGIKTVIQKDLRLRPSEDISTTEYFRKAMDRNTTDVTTKLEYFLATGNLRSQSIEAMQVAGWTVSAEKLNYLRYIAHFRSVHRGQFFTSLRTTAVRKLLPEAWGFICPVHTPDGGPCGLLNHLAASCEVTTKDSDTSRIPRLLASLGMIPAMPQMPAVSGYVPVMVDGRIVGRLPPALLSSVSDRLRYLKVQGHEDIPADIEIAHMPLNTASHAGLYIFGVSARMIRQVTYLPTNSVEYIGPLEQEHLTIAVLDEDIVPHVTIHRELQPTSMLSMVASLTPFSDFNQSPRNMYQCQMGKQAMAFPSQALQYRADNKMYKLQHHQTPIVRTKGYVDYGIDEFPSGCNAVVAVLSYTGYDMEDAMIINKSAYERGFGHGQMFKTQPVDLGKKRERGGGPIHVHFAKPPTTVVDDKEMHPTFGDLSALDADGLPQVGVLLNKGDPLYSTYDDVTGKYRVERYKSMEPARVDMVRVLDSDDNVKELQRINIKLRINRNPIIGDKFSSRHGQKGVLSQLWPTVDMPFSESGIQPDVIINPHAFPSRMTIGMLVESMAGKAGALHGIFQDGTPFRFDEKNRAVDYFGEQLTAAGFNYYGNEPMYSGIHGTELHADIYIGVVFYQRLRHMVSDKYQVRSTGPVNELTQQPIKGRKVGGGIRFGEMERDSLLAHGVSFLLNDRLMRSSDYSQAFVCRLCGSLLSPVTEPGATQCLANTSCRVCDSVKGVEVIAIPYVFRFLVNELAAMNVRAQIDIS
eukprot:TRINITY_DN13613_c0_g1_i1.p1 TRINITY_DN13613_c0_g1~~TRINITY_DN13613_c0_g1_i1.p1  ORF type:complete len:1144 (+),score=256.01 TRINITY_DN13613_c0_g1_i1:497-3433(+)